MKMHAARFGLMSNGTYAPLEDDDLVAFYSKPPIRYIEQVAKGTERITFANPGNVFQPETWGDMITHALWCTFGPALSPGVITQVNVTVEEEQ